jgi:DNA-binding MarR family transcriptional regulator
MSDAESLESVDPVVLRDVKRSNRKAQVLLAVSEKPRMNGKLADELGLSTQYVGRQMKWLEDHGLIEELTGKPNYKLYNITEKGQQIVELM